MWPAAAVVSAFWALLAAFACNAGEYETGLVFSINGVAFALVSIALKDDER